MSRFSGSYCIHEGHDMSHLCACVCYKQVVHMSNYDCTCLFRQKSGYSICRCQVNDSRRRLRYNINFETIIKSQLVLKRISYKFTVG